MKKIVFITLFVLVLLVFTGCGKEAYSFQYHVNEIKSIEIVSAENSLEFTIIKTLSETEKNDFLKQFQTIQFNSYYVGDPLSVNGNAVKVTYQNGTYEMICYYWAEYVENGLVYSVRKSCSEKDFNELLNRFLE